MNIDLNENNVEVNLGEKKLNLDFGTQKINSGTKYHNELINLDFENSGHTGFASVEDINELNEELLNYVKDEDYNHTDNNFTDEDKEKLDSLENFSGSAKDVKFEDGETFQQKYDSGELKGDDGYTPIKGIDYFDGKDGQNGTDGIDGEDGKDGVSVTHSWNGTTLTITSASGTSSADLKGEKGDTGEAGKDGTNGTNGKDGVDGKDGYTPVKGVDYFDGQDGANGEDGYTPIKGVDYYTEADKQEMVELVLNAIPSSEGVSY